MVYEPKEDSYLLEKIIANRAKGCVLDMGTGSGILARSAHSSTKVTSVVAADIDLECEFAEKGITFVHSDLFSNITGVFDTIVSNTPYLPSDYEFPDLALDGGKKGFEWTCKFLTQAKAHLTPDGIILFLISTRTNPQIIEKTLLEQGYEWEVIATEKLFMEELLVYEAKRVLSTRPEAEYLAKGKRSRVYREGDVIIKKAEPRRVAQEVLMLHKVNAVGIGPKLVEHTENTITMEYIDAERIDTWLKSATPAQTKHVLREVIHQLKFLQYMKIEKQEMTRPVKHILVKENTPVLIDWERAKVKRNPANLRQFSEYLKHLQKKHPHLHISLEYINKTFDDRVYTAVQDIPAGRVRTYGDIAKTIGCGSAQAVGQALRRNPYAPFVPCHRVIARGGRIHGFRGNTTGKDVQDKVFLLEAEGVIIKGGVVETKYIINESR